MDFEIRVEFAFGFAVEIVVKLFDQSKRKEALHAADKLREYQSRLPIRVV